MEILAPFTARVLEEYFQDGPGRDVFYLGGGTALALVEFQHRRSDDLDLFSREPRAVVDFAESLRVWCVGKGYAVEPGLSGSSDQHRRLFLRSGDDTVRLDLAIESPAFLDLPRTINGLRIESRRDLLASKLWAMFDRGEMRDFIDGYFILKYSGEDRGGLLKDVRTKFGGVDFTEMASRLLSYTPRGAMPAFLESYLIRKVSLEEVVTFLHAEGEAIKELTG